MLTAQLRDSAPGPNGLRSAGGRQVKGNWAAAGLTRRPDTRFLLGVPDQPLPRDRRQAIRGARNATPHERDQDPGSGRSDAAHPDRRCTPGHIAAELVRSHGQA